MPRVIREIFRERILDEALRQASNCVQFNPHLLMTTCEEHVPLAKTTRDKKK